MELCGVRYRVDNLNGGKNYTKGGSRDLKQEVKGEYEIKQEVHDETGHE